MQLGRFFQIDGKQLGQQYKHYLSDFSSWEQKAHATEWMLFEQNIGSCLSIDETAFSSGELYTNKYISIADSLKTLKLELVEKYNVQDDTVSQKTINLSTSAQSSHKLQWMGKSKVLISLFYDLYSNVENGGEPLIKASKDQIKNFLLNNFLEKDGQPLSPSSIDTLLTPSKEDKRALKDDRIDTSKLKEKK